MRFRFAGPGPDLSAFDEMLRRYLMEEAKAGSPVRMTRRTLDFYRDLARGYLIGAEAGLLVFAEDETAVWPQPTGFTLAGAGPWLTWIDTEHGKTATVWITWMEPRFRKKGAALGMLAFGEPKLLDLGFEVAAMSVREENPSGQKLSLAFGAQPIERFYHYALGVTEHGRR
jgi:hypothetical protein